MGKHNARPRPGRMIPVLGTSCGLLAAAAFTGGLQPAVALPEAGDGTVTVARDTAETAPDATALLGGPLQMPEIGVVAPGFDERYAALLSASHTSAAPPPPARVVTPSRRTTPPAPTSPPPVTPSSSDDASPTPTARPPVTPPVDERPAGKPPGEEPPVQEPPVVPPPVTPPAEKPPADGPSVETPPVETPPAEEPAEEPLEDVELSIGDEFEVLDASGQPAYTIVLDALVPDVACTADGHLPAENDHFIGLQVRVVAGPAPAEGTPAPVIDTSDFEALGADGAPVVEAHTASAAACLDEAESFPSTPLTPDQETEGTIVLDVAEDTGGVAFRPAAPAVSLLWRF